MEAMTHLADEGVGYLDMRDYNKARWAYEQSHPASPFMRWLKIAGYVSFDAEDVRVQSSSSGHINIPATKLAWEEITRLSNELNQWRGVDEAACDQFGAFLLVELGREVSTAAARWPMEDKPHKVMVMRCGGCEQLTLMYRPPRFEGDAIKVDCGERCGYELSEDEFGWAVSVVEKEEHERQLGERRRGGKAGTEIEADGVSVGS